MSASRSRPGTGLLDRHGERAVVDGVLDQARAGSSAVLVVRGEPGIGKTALLGYAAGRALGFRVIWAWGVESEMELAFAGLHQLCVPMLDGWNSCRDRSATRSRSRSACRRARLRTASWSGWRC